MGSWIAFGLGGFLVVGAILIAWLEHTGGRISNWPTTGDQHHETKTKKETKPAETHNQSRRLTREAV